MSNEATIKLNLLLKNHITTPLMQAKEAISKNVSEMKEKLHSLSLSHTKAFQSMKDEIPGFSRAIELVTNPYILATAAVIGLGVAFTKAGSMSLDWEKGLAKINVTAGLSQGELAKLSSNLLSIGSNNVAPLEQIPDAFNKLISAGLDVNQSLAALDPTLKAAKAGFTDVETTAKAAVNVMASSGEDVNKVYDVLFATLNKGNAEFKDIAQYLPKLVPMAKQAGFALGETAGAFAFMTAQGQTAEASTTLLQNAFKSLSDPSKVKNFEKMGVAIYQDGKMKPFISIVKELSNELNGLTDEQRAKKLAKLGLDQEAATAFAIMTQNTEKLSGIIDATTNSSGALTQAYKDSLTSTDMWYLSLNKVKAIVIGIGNKFLPLVRWSGELALSFTEWLLPALVTVKNLISEYYPIFITIAVGVAAYNAATIMAATWTGILAAKTWLVTTATNAWKVATVALNAVSPWGWVIIALTAVGALVTWLVLKFEGWGTLWNALKVTLVNGFMQYVNTWKFGFVDLWLSVQIFWAKIKSFGEYIGEAFSNIGQAIKLALTGNFSEAKDILSKKITTKSEIEVTALEKERGANLEQYKTESAKRAKEVVDAWKAVKITKKATEESSTSTGVNGNGTGDNNPLKDASTDNNNSNNNVTDTTDKIAGSAKQIRNITVNIDAFNKGGINTQNTNMSKMGTGEIEDWFNQAMLRMIRNLEMSYSE